MKKTIKLWNLINDENNMPKLNIINEIDYTIEGPKIIDPYETIPILCKLSNLHKAHAENIYMATYNHENELIGFFHIATGHMDKCDASNRIIATCLLMVGGFSFSIFHNHSVDDLTPSENDKLFTANQRALAIYIEAKYLSDYAITRSGWVDINTEEEYKFTESELQFINL